MLAITDESTPELVDGSVVYGLSMVMLPDAAAAEFEVACSSVIDRKRPFHWAAEGPVVRGRMIDALSRSPVHICVAAVVVREAHQEAARHVLFGHLLTMAAHHDVTSLLIESRTPTSNARDKGEIRNWYRNRGPRTPTFGFTDKRHALTWAADAAAGLWTDAVMNRTDPGWLPDLVSAQRIAQLTLLPMGS